MNGRNAKRIRKEAKEMMLAWYQDLLTEEERCKVTTSNVVEFANIAPHTRSFGTVKLSTFSYKWFVKLIKQGKDPKDFYL